MLIQPGTFTMGSPDGELGRFPPTETQHQVTLTRAFYLQKTEVTQGRYLALMGHNPSHFKKAGDAAPVEFVSWWEALKYANALSKAENLPACYTLTGCSEDGSSCKDVSANAAGGNPYACTGYRLPTEAEWEYAYRAGTTTAFFNGPLTQEATGDPNLDAIGWYGGNSGASYQGCYTGLWSGLSCAGTQPTGQKQANAWGLHDMAGNVWEWCWDWFVEDPGGDAVDPLGPTSGLTKVVRGGAWHEVAQYSRAAFRSGLPIVRTYGLGFRLARSRP